MRERVLLVACLSIFSVFAACVGDEVPVGPTPGGNDGGADQTSPTTDSGGPVGDGGGGTDAANDQDSGPPACTTIAVTTLTGTGAAGLVEGAGNVAQFNDSQGITVGPDGTLYLGDHANKRIRKILTDGTTSTYATSATNMLSAYRLNYRAGDIWLIDRTNDALVRVTGSVPPNVSISYQTGALQAVGASSTAMYVSTTQDGTIRKMNPAINNSTVFAGNASATGTADGDALSARFSADIIDFAFDSPGIMYVADRGNFRIRKVLESDGTTSTLAGSTQGFADGTGTAAKFDSPSGITVDPVAHVLYVADNTRIRAVSQTGVVTTIAGSTAGFDDGNACVAKFGELRGIVYYAGALYAVDVNKVRKIKLP